MRGLEVAKEIRRPLPDMFASVSGDKALTGSRDPGNRMIVTEDAIVCGWPSADSAASKAVDPSPIL
jgi:hypothetical protein